MKPFVQIAIPHEDILKGRLTMDVFAADLWQVVTGKAPLDYVDKDVFFRKTYLTKGLANILETAKRRLEGKSGDSVIQLQTPFGGGKTHALIALYHKAKEWNAKVVVLDGTAFDPKEVRLWEELERQLTGRVKIMRGDVSPGKGKLIDIIEKNSPVLILIDEILEYATKAAGVKVGDSNLASQTLAFIQELTGAVSTVDKALLVIALPSSVLEHYDENAEKLYHQLQKIAGRTEKIYTPVEEDEIEYVIRKRLFQSIDEDEVKKVVDEFIEYAKREGLLSGEEAIKYRGKFLRSYPFKPEVIDVLYKRWGSFPTFQRTRGVLRLLSLVVHDLIDKKIPFIRLGDFNLENDEIKRELIKHIGQEYDSIIAQDITSDDSGAKKVDYGIGDAYRPYKLGTVVSTTIFMLSFSGGPRRGTSIREIKLFAAYTDFSSSIIDTVLNKLKEYLFYLSDDGLYFTNQPNLNKILITREENITREEAIEYERELLKKHLSMKKSKFSIYIWPRDHKDIPDTEAIKLVILRESKPDREFIERYGERPRVYRNTIIFLCTDPNQQESFYKFIRKILALRSIDKDKKLRLTDSQKKEIKNRIRLSEKRTYEEIRKYYRKVFVPSREDFKEIDLGIPTFGGESYIDNEIYSRLRSEGELLEKLSPKVIKEKYLSSRDYVETKNIHNAIMTTPGELRIVSLEVLKQSIEEGVKKGIFGLGYIEDNLPDCKYFKECASPEFLDNEIIVDPNLCIRETIKVEKLEKEEKIKPTLSEAPFKKPTKKEIEEHPAYKTYSRIYLKLKPPVGRISDIVRIINYLKKLFSECTVKIEIMAQDGSIKVTDYENIIEEALRQAGIEIEKEEKE